MEKDYCTIILGSLRINVDFADGKETERERFDRAVKRAEKMLRSRHSTQMPHGSTFVPSTDAFVIAHDGDEWHPWAQVHLRGE